MCKAKVAVFYNVSVTSERLRRGRLALFDVSKQAADKIVYWTR